MYKEVWVDCRDKNLKSQAELYGATGIIEDEIKIYTLNSKEDLDKLPIGVDYLFVNFANWKAIPAENVIAKYNSSNTKIIVKTNNVNDLEMIITALEKGVDGFLVSEEASIKEFCNRIESNLSLKLVDAEVTDLKNIRRGKRVCIDGADGYKPRQGMLVGCFNNSLFLVNAETSENPHVNTREWRVNAGASAMYSLCKHEGIITKRYLNDIRMGDDIIMVDHEGNTKIQTVLRVKIEERPMILLKLQYNNIQGGVCLQNAETIKLLTPDENKPITEIKKGDLIKAYYTEVKGVHFGMPVNEYIKEQ